MDNEKSDQVIDSSKLGTEATIGRAIQYQGVPYYMTQMNAWLRGFAEKVNEIFHGEYEYDPAISDYVFSANGFDANGEAGSIFFTGRRPTDGEYGALDLLGGYGNGLYVLTAGNITILDELMRDADRLGSKSSDSVGNEESVQVQLMIQLLNSKEMFSFRNGTAKDFLEMILGDIALNASNANTFFNTYKGLSNAIDNQRSSISGVDEDEEAVNLVKYQNAYNLSSRMIQTLTEIYNRLILQTGV
jgi:flagellar hook-associated protein 1 FlgK